MIDTRWILDEAQPGHQNMGADAASIELVLGGFSQPIFRIYSWKPHCLSLGYHQPTTEVNFPAIHQAGIEVVRRPTGGKAVFHAAEITYSCIVPLGELAASEWYANIHNAFREALIRQNVNTEFKAVSDTFKDIYTGLTSVPCFISSAQSELELNGKKLVGSAQRQYGPVLLQHGSILVDRSHEQITGLLRWKSDEEKNKAEKLLSNRSCSISQVAATFSTHQFIADLHDVLPAITGLNPIPDTWKPEELELIHQLSKKYRIQHEH